MRHHLVVHLQPIGMVHEVMERRLKAAEPKLAEVIESAAKIRGFARAALDSSVDMITWLAPDERATATVPDAVRECIGLVGTSFTFRGFALRDGVGEMPGEVRRAAIRATLMGALLYLSDAREPPAEIMISAAPTDAGIDVVLTLRPGGTEPGFSTTPIYRPLAWSDVEALAGADGVGLDRQGTSVIRLSFPFAAKTS